METILTHAVAAILGAVSGFFAAFFLLFSHDPLKNVAPAPPTERKYEGPWEPWEPL